MAHAIDPQYAATGRRPWRSIATKAAFAALALGTLASMAAAMHLYTYAHRFNRLVAVSWGQVDPHAPPALYGAYVWLDGREPNLRATLSIYIGRPSTVLSYRFDDRDLGTVPSEEEAVARWGDIRWSAEGLHVGQGHAGVLMPAAELTNHR
jgi:hypothetical protein